MAKIKNRRFSLVDISNGPTRDTLTLRIRWWAYPIIMMQAACAQPIRPRWQWAWIAPWVLLIGIRMSWRSLRGRCDLQNAMRVAKRP